MPNPHNTQMTELAIVGGVYREVVVWPAWDQIYGSAGRAAVALNGHIDKIVLHYYAEAKNKDAFRLASQIYGIDCQISDSQSSVSFEYTHCLSTPRISPAKVRSNPPINVGGSAVLRFGMLEGTAIIDADYCVYDPQSPTDPESFSLNGSAAKHLAIVCNRSELASLTGQDEIAKGAAALLAEAEVVVVKAGAAGAFICDKNGINSVPAFQTDSVWTVGSGDVFAAVFAAYWAVHKLPPIEAATLASMAVANYADTMSLPVPAKVTLLSQERVPAKTQQSSVYLASPFFTMSQLWLVDEARKNLKEMGLSVFSPLHDIGHGPAATVAPADLKAIKDCDCVFALVDGLDSGTLLEIGYARAFNKPVYALSQATGDEDLKMVIGSGCKVFSDYATAIYHTAWRS